MTVRATSSVPSIAFLHPGDTAHGVTRYALVVADAVEAVGGRVRRIAPRHPGSLASVFTAALRARRAEVVHVQLTRQYWGRGRRHLWAVLALRLALLRRPLVVTAHDFHTAPRDHRGDGTAWWRRRPGRLPVDDAAALLLLGTADLVMTCSRPEAEVLAWTRPRRTAVVPHFVERRPAAADAAAPRHRGDGPLVVLGYIHRRKGQLTAVRALPLVPHRRLVLAGTATAPNQTYLQEVLTEAEQLGVGERVEVTGFLSEEQLDATLASARAALAPYERIAASGSLSTLAAAGVPVVARSHPYLASMAAACPAAVHLYDGDSPAALAEAVDACLAQDRSAQRLELLAWAEQYSPERTGRRHLEQYATVWPARAVTQRVPVAA